MVTVPFLPVHKILYLCRTEEKSSMSILPSVINVCHMCGFSGVEGVLWGVSKGLNGACGNGAVDS
jgi:hypothetical protein